MRSEMGQRKGVSGSDGAPAQHNAYQRHQNWPQSVAVSDGNSFGCGELSTLSKFSNAKRGWSVSKLIIFLFLFIDLFMLCLRDNSH